MEKKDLYEAVYMKLNKVTPLRKDCGLLCARACCQGSDHETLGMYLFPGEEIMFKNDKNAKAYFKIIQTELRVSGESEKGQAVLLLSCEGRCDRNLRPIACRLFPLIPYLGEKNILRIKIDPRARGICPLVNTNDLKITTSLFRAEARKASQLLAKDQEIRAFIKALSLLLDEYELDPLYFIRTPLISDQKNPIQKPRFTIRLNALSFQSRLT